MSGRHEHGTRTPMLLSTLAPITRRNFGVKRCAESMRARRRVTTVGSLFVLGCLLLAVRRWDLLLLSRPASSSSRGDTDIATGGSRVSAQQLVVNTDQTRTAAPAPAPAPPAAESGDFLAPSESSKDGSQQSQDKSSLPVADLKPLLTCRQSRSGNGTSASDESSPIMRKKKLAFVHIFKTAGSTMRGLFDRYSARCGLGWALVVSCTSADAESVLHTNTTWKKRDKKGKCHLKRWTRADDGRRFDGLEGDSARFDGQFLRENVDIVGGHLPLGVADHTWSSSDDSGEELRYLAFFRDALYKYVSARMYVKIKKGNGKGKELSYFVDLIKDEVTRHLARGEYYEGYYKYLITPEQVEAIERTHRFRNMTAERRVAERARIVRRNMIEYDVICGITERMPQSLEVLHHVIDPDGGARDIFEEWGMPYRNGTLPPMHVSNPSRGFKTSTVVKELERDPAFFAKLKEYVKYEQQVTEFAIVMHGKQYESMKRQREALQY